MIIALIIYAIIGILCYFTVAKKLNQTGFNRIWCSIFWITLIPLYFIHVIHNKL